MNGKIEAVFGGVLALCVLAAAAFAILSFKPDTIGGGGSSSTANTGSTVVAISDPAGSTVCQCYDQAFKLAGSGVDVLSAQYRTGFEQCQALGKQDGADAWTAGWNARLSAKPFEASCRRYLASSGKRI